VADLATTSTNLFLSDLPLLTNLEVMADNARKIEEPDAEELGGLVTKPFKFVTGMRKT
jgi:hypothetical protein